jgi:Sec-independent protein translocase protein TatA
MPAVWQKLRPAVRELAQGFREFRHGLRCAARSRDAKDRAGQQREQDCAIGSPSPAAARNRVAEGKRRATGGIDPIELAIGKECQRPAVGRPKGEWGDP